MENILIVEDEVVISRYLEETLEAEGYSAATANTVEEAMYELDNFTPDLVLMDINLDDEIDGIELTKKFLQQNNNLGIIFLTSDSTASTLKRVSEINYLNYILKPIDENQLKISVRLAIEKQRKDNRAGNKILEQISNLTKTEKKIICLLANDNTTEQVSDRLFVSKKTIENHRYNICKKLNLKPQKNTLLIFVSENKELLKVLK